MTPPFPVGRRIIRLAGLLEREDIDTHARHYTVVIELEDSTIALLAQSSVATLPTWPADARDMPTQILDRESGVVGSLITEAIVRHRLTDNESGINGPQLFLILEGERLMGAVPTQRGTMLHVEAVLSSPLLRRQDRLVTLDGRSISLDEIVLL